MIRNEKRKVKAYTSLTDLSQNFISTKRTLNGNLIQKIGVSLSEVATVKIGKGSVVIELRGNHTKSEICEILQSPLRQ